MTDEFLKFIHGCSNIRTNEVFEFLGFVFAGLSNNSIFFRSKIKQEAKTKCHYMKRIRQLLRDG